MKTAFQYITKDDDKMPINKCTNDNDKHCDDHCKCYDIKNNPKDLNDKECRCDINNHINLYVNDTKNNSIDCKPQKDKKYGCCCDTTKLREMLMVFRKNNTPVIIFSETLLAFELLESDQDFAFSRYIHAIINNMVYISKDSSNGEVIYIIPLCNISFVIALSPAPITGISDIIDEIMTETTLEKNDCCCISGIGDTLNSLSNFYFLLPLSSGLFAISANEISFGYIWVLTLSIFLLLPFEATSTVANDDIYVMYSNSTNSNFYAIVPACKIDVLAMPQNLIATSILKTSSAINSPILKGLLSLLNKDMRAKIEKLDIDKLSNDIKGKSMDEILEKIKSMLK